MRSQTGRASLLQLISFDSGAVLFNRPNLVVIEDDHVIARETIDALLAAFPAATQSEFRDETRVVVPRESLRAALAFLKNRAAVRSAGRHHLRRLFELS